MISSHKRNGTKIYQDLIVLATSVGFYFKKIVRNYMRLGNNKFWDMQKGPTEENLLYIKKYFPFVNCYYETKFRLPFFGKTRMILALRLVFLKEYSKI